MEVLRILLVLLFHINFLNLSRSRLFGSAYVHILWFYFIFCFRGCISAVHLCRSCSCILGMEQESLVLRMFDAVRTYGLKDERIIYLFLQSFREKLCAAGYMNGGRHLQRVVQTSTRRLSFFENIDEPSTLEVLLFLLAVFFIHLFLDNRVRALRKVGPQTESTVEIVIQSIL